MSQKWTKKAASKELGLLTEETKILASKSRLSEEHVRWVSRTLRFLEQIFGQESRYYKNFQSLTWRREGSFVIGGPARPHETDDPEIGFRRVHQEAYKEQLGIARGLLLAAKDELENSDMGSVYKGKDSGPEASILLRIINLAEHKLRKTIRNSPNAEKEIQDNFENLLIGTDIPYSRETDSIEYSAKTYTPDFTIQKSDLTIEMKLCGKNGREKEIIAEINDDILAYQTKYGNIIFIIYDIGIIRDADRFIGNFEENEGVIVKIIKH